MILQNAGESFLFIVFALRPANDAPAEVTILNGVHTLVPKSALSAEMPLMAGVAGQGTIRLHLKLECNHQRFPCCPTAL